MCVTRCKDKGRIIIGKPNGEKIGLMGYFLLDTMVMKRTFKWYRNLKI